MDFDVRGRLLNFRTQSVLFKIELQVRILKAIWYSNYRHKPWFFWHMTTKIPEPCHYLKTELLKVKIYLMPGLLYFIIYLWLSHFRNICRDVYTQYWDGISCLLMLLAPDPLHYQMLMLQYYHKSMPWCKTAITHMCVSNRVVSVLQ